MNLINNQALGCSKLLSLTTRQVARPFRASSAMETKFFKVSRRWIQKDSDLTVK
jgi:hypothetical protein